MIAGIGIDACEITRMETELEKGRILDRYYTKAESDYVLSKGAMAARSLAALFAAKEAALKALGVGLSGIALKDVQILHHSSGQPYYALTGKAFEVLKGGRMHLSITHEAGLAIAMAIYEKDA